MRATATRILILAVALGAAACAPRGPATPPSPSAELPPSEEGQTAEEPAPVIPPPAAQSPPSDPQDCSRAERLLRHSMRLRDPGERSHVLERAEALCPEDVNVLVALASAYRDDGEADLAASLARRAIALDPGHPGATSLLEALRR